MKVRTTRPHHGWPLRMLLTSGLLLAVASPVRSAEPTEPEAAPAGDGSLEVLVHPGARALEPIAVPEPHCVDAKESDCATVAAVLRRDMLLTFFFKVLPPRSYLADPKSETVDAPRWADWMNIGAKYLIKAELKGPAPYRLELRFYNVVKRELKKVKRQSARDLSAKGVRAAVHRFCNHVLAAVTPGGPGPFGTRIAYAYKGGPGVKGIGIMDMDGANRGGLVGNGSINLLPSWGLGGVLYTSFIGGRPELYVGRKKFSRDAGHYRKVAVSKQGTIVASISYGGQSDLYQMSKSGEVIRNLTRTAADEVSPTFSPDGSKLAFVSSAAGTPQIYMMNAGGGGMRRLTHAGNYNYAPDWGPSGLIAFTAMDEGGNDIFTVDEGGTIVRLTQNQGSNRYPSWSRDGRYIAFVSSRAGRGGLWLMSADGRYQFRVAKGGGLSNVAWQR